MKSENEIREKIDEYMDELSALKRQANASSQEWREDIVFHYAVIDSLLWIIGDRSGNLI